MKTPAFVSKVCHANTYDFFLFLAALGSGNGSVKRKKWIGIFIPDKTPQTFRIMMQGNKTFVS